VYWRLTSDAALFARTSALANLPWNWCFYGSCSCVYPAAFAVFLIDVALQLSVRE
jgi:hypothetical protein